MMAEMRTKRIKQGLWYLCHTGTEYFSEGYFHYSPADGVLVGRDGKEHIVTDLTAKCFDSGKIIRIASPIRQNKEQPCKIS